MSGKANGEMNGGAVEEVAVPAYVNETLVRDVLRNGLQVVDPKVTHLTIVPATVRGENYMSDVFRMAVRYTGAGTDTETSISLVVKCLPRSGERGNMIEEILAYEKEADMFQLVVPRLTTIAGGDFFAARCLLATRDPERMLVFEDLKSLGYVLAKRQLGLDFDHCALIMRKIGRFHAASMRYTETNQELLRRRFHFNIFNPDQEKHSGNIDTIFQKGLETMIAVAERNWKTFDQRILEKLKRLLPVYVQKLNECVTQNCDDGYRVLNHGDLWSSNMLFRYDGTTGAVEDVVFVDYQISYYSSPGIDLNYAISNCPNLETRDRTEELIDIYYRSFRGALEAIGYAPVPTMDDVRREIKRMEFFALVSVVSVLPIVLTEPTNEITLDFETLMGGEDADRMRELQYNGAVYQSIVRPMLEEFDRRQMLDI